MKNKVCHVISGYYRMDARVFLRQCMSLKNANYEVTILTNDGSGDEIINGIKFYDCAKNKSSRLKTLLFSKKQFIEKAIEINADIYQLHSPELIPLGRYLKKTGKKIVYDAHEDLPRHILEKEWLPVFTRPIISKLTEYYLNNSLKKFDFTITPHSHVFNDLNNRKIKVELIENFPLIKEEEVFSEKHYLDRDNIICYTGTVYSYSNQKTISTVIKQFPKLKYQIAGYIDVGQLEMLNTNIPSQFKFFGRLNPKELSDFYKKSRIGIVVYDYLLNLGYNLGSYGTNKIFEYMEEGLPIICTDYKLWKEICNKYNCGIYVPPNDEKALFDAINKLVQNPQRAYQMGLNGKTAIKLEYNWTNVEIKYLKVFKYI